MRGAQPSPGESPTTGPAIVDLALGWLHSCALTAEGAVYCWGHNGDGQLGIGAAIERAVHSLDREGLFSGTPLAREDMIVTVEVMPPDHTNTARTMRLNPRGPALTAWLDEAAEPAAYDRP